MGGGIKKWNNCPAIRVRVRGCTQPIKSVWSLVLPCVFGLRPSKAKTAPPAHPIDFIAYFYQLHFFVALVSLVGIIRHNGTGRQATKGHKMKTAKITLIYAAAALIAAHTIATGLDLADRLSIPATQQQPAHLVGIGCKGYDHAIFRQEEDEFPECEAIQRLTQWTPKKCA